MKRLTLLAVSVMVGVLCSCEQYIIEGPDVPTDVSFSDDIQPIFNAGGANCVQCHNGGRDPDLSEGNSYDALIDGGYVDTDNPEESGIYTIFSGSHASRATLEEQAFILGWVYEGAENN